MRNLTRRQNHLVKHAPVYTDDDVDITAPGTWSSVESQAARLTGFGEIAVSEK